MYLPRTNHPYVRRRQRRIARTPTGGYRDLNRRDFLKLSAMTSAFALAVGCQPLQPLSDNSMMAGMPKAIPGGSELGDPLPFIHMYLPTPTIAPPGAPTISERTGDPSTVFDFTGDIGVFEPFGGTGTDGDGNTLYWAADVRFMKGQYVDMNGTTNDGAFAFL